MCCVFLARSRPSCNTTMPLNRLCVAATLASCSSILCGSAVQWPILLHAMCGGSFTMAYPSSCGAFAVRGQLNKDGVLLNADARLAEACGYAGGRCECVGCICPPPPHPPSSSSTSPLPMFSLGLRVLRACVSLSSLRELMLRHCCC
jgi:hypothetical protein